MTKRFFVSDDALPMSEDAEFETLAGAQLYTAARQHDELNIGEYTDDTIVWHLLRSDLPPESYLHANWCTCCDHHATA